jgi:hypothetical protein
MFKLFLKYLLTNTCIVFLFIKFNYPTAYLDYKGVNYIFNYQHIVNSHQWLMDYKWLIGIIFMSTLFTFGCFEIVSLFYNRANKIITFIISYILLFILLLVYLK